MLNLKKLPGQHSEGATRRKGQFKIPFLLFRRISRVRENLISFDLILIPDESATKKKVCLKVSKLGFHSYLSLMI